MRSGTVFAIDYCYNNNDIMNFNDYCHLGGFPMPAPHRGCDHAQQDNNPFPVSKSEHEQTREM